MAVTNPQNNNNQQRRPEKRFSADNRRGRSTYTNLPESNPLHPDIASQFKAQSYTNNPLNHDSENISGVQNPTIERTDSKSSANNRKKVARANEEVERIRGEYANAENNRITRYLAKKDIENIGVVRKNFARARALPISAGISVWAIPWYLFVQLPLGILATLSLGIAYQLSTIDATNVAGELAATIANMSSHPFFFVYLAFSIFIFFFYCCQIAIASGLYKIGLINPWFGRGASIKVLTLIIVLISSFIPILQILPVLGLWVFAVILSPK